MRTCSRAARPALGHLSLAAHLPNGRIAVTDDLHDRVLVIDRASKAIVCTREVGVAGRGPGYLNIPYGLELLP